jgi:hypothetical protein
MQPLKNTIKIHVGNSGRAARGSHGCMRRSIDAPFHCVPRVTSRRFAVDPRAASPLNAVFGRGSGARVPRPDQGSTLEPATRNNAIDGALCRRLIAVYLTLMSHRNEDPRRARFVALCRHGRIIHGCLYISQRVISRGHDETTMRAVCRRLAIVQCPKSPAYDLCKHSTRLILY